MKKREQGVLSVEASIVLTLILLFILFLFGFGRAYRAQNLVGHAALQTADAVALESYLRETALQSDAADVVYLASHISDSSAISVESLESLRSANLPKLAREKFIAAIAASEGAADDKLRSMGVKGGLEGVDFSECKMDLASDDVIIAISYTLEMQFPVFGFNEIPVTKTAKAKTFGEILFSVTTKPNNPGWGSTSGDSKVTHGSEVEITADPNYGYKFVGWDDNGDGIPDSTENPRKVVADDSKESVAIFEKDRFGVNLKTRITYNTELAAIRHTNYGTVTGAGNFEYQETIAIAATPMANYEFVGWDDNGDGKVDNASASRSITVDKTYELTAIFKPKVYAITVQSNNTSYGTAQAVQGANKGTTIQAEYGTRVQLIATVSDSVKYLFQKWNNSSTQSTTTITVEKPATYVAEFITNTYTVTFYNGSTVHHTTKVIRGSSISGSQSLTSSSMPGNPSKSGGQFDYWKCGGNKFTSTTTVNSDLRVDAVWKYSVTLNANGGSVSGSSTKTYWVSGGGTFNFDQYGASRNGFSFNGWYSGSTRYSGTKTINSNISVTASWNCKHRWDNGGSMYSPISSTGGGCSNSRTVYRCSGCGHQYEVAGTGACSYNAWCGTVHNCNWGTQYCTNGGGTYHKWTQFGCITCSSCGRLYNAKYSGGMWRSGSSWCVRHNGHTGVAVCSKISGPHG